MATKKKTKLSPKKTAAPKREVKPTKVKKARAAKKPGRKAKKA